MTGLQRMRLCSARLHLGDLIVEGAHAMAGRVDATRQACVTYQQFDPAVRVSNVNDRREQDIQKFEQGLRLAGLLE